MTEPLKPCPHCGSFPDFVGDASEWKDDHRYVELSLGCCAMMTEAIGWKRARDMSAAERESDLRQRLTEAWNKRHVPEEPST